MARDSIRPFIVGLLFVYLLDPPVRWLVRRGLRRTLAILVVYVVGIVAFIEFLALTLTPLVNEVLRFVERIPEARRHLDGPAPDGWATSTSVSRSRPRSANGSTASIAGIGSGGSGGGGIDLAFLLPLITGASSLLGARLRLLHPAGLGRLHPQGQGRRSSRHSTGRCPQSWRFDTWASSGPSSATSASGSAASSSSASSVGVLTFIGLIVLSQLVDPIFGRYAVLLSVIAGMLELVPIIGPIISAVPAVLLAATGGPRSR